MALKFPGRGLYAVTQDGYPDVESLGRAVSLAIEAGAVVVQYRAKASLQPQAESRHLQGICRDFGVPLIINDNVELARLIGADGVHLGRGDMAIEDAREYLGKDSIIGVSCYDSLERAKVAESCGADYVAFGRFFSSKSKPLAQPARLDTLFEAKKYMTVPVVAIGGITVDNGASVLAAGADLLAVIDGVFGQSDPFIAAFAFNALF